MKKMIKNNKKLILGIFIGILVSSISVYAATTYLADDILYKNTTVKGALDDLYSKNLREAVKVRTVTDKSDSYTFLNDGYILGKIKSEYRSSNAIVYFGDHSDDSYDGSVAVATNDYNGEVNVSLHVEKGTTVYTRNKGTYNLEYFEYK